MPLEGTAGPAIDGLKDYRLPLDEPLFAALNGTPAGAVVDAFVGVSSDGFGLAMLAAVAVTLIARHKERAVVPLLVLLGSVGLTFALVHGVLQPASARLRPCFALPPEKVHLWVEVGRTSSLPSLQAAWAFTVALAGAFSLHRFSAVFLSVAVAVAASRVVVGAHWPSDVVAGALVGAGVAFGLQLLAGQLAARVGWVEQLFPEHSA